MDGTYCRNTPNETDILGVYSSDLCFWIYAGCICNYKLLLRNRSNMKHYIIGTVLSWCLYELTVGDIDRISRVIPRPNILIELNTGTISL